MKNIVGFFFLILVLFSACSKDSNPCEGIVCKNGGTSVVSGSECTCVCANFYTGEFCETPINEQYAGTYNGTTSCQNYPNEADSYLLTIESEGPNFMLIHGFGEIEFTTNKSFVINSGYGSGTIENNILNINYTSFSQGSFTTTTCSFTGSK